MPTERSSSAWIHAQEEKNEKRRNFYRWIYLPYSWMIFMPFLALTTLMFGSIAALIAKFSPRMAFHCGTIWSWLLCRVNFTHVRLTGRHNAVRGRSYIIMSNHQSHFDIPAFYGHWGRQFRWVIKEELRKTPGLGWYCKAGGHIFVDRSSHKSAIQSLQKAKSMLQGGTSVMFFPEGTRSKDGRMQTFKKGGFMLALSLELPILPVSISGSRHVLPGKTLKLLPGKVDIRIHQPIDPTMYGPDRRAELIEEVRNVIASGLTLWEQAKPTVSTVSPTDRS